MTTQRVSAGAMDAVTQELLRAKDEETARLAETVLRITQVLDGARHIDREARLLLDVLLPDIVHAQRTYSRFDGAGWNAGLTRKQPLDDHCELAGSRAREIARRF